MLTVVIPLIIVATTATGYIEYAVARADDERGQAVVSCTTCHSEKENLDDDDFSHRDHRDVGCAVCHGGEIDIEAVGEVIVPSCVTCHRDRDELEDDEDFHHGNHRDVGCVICHMTSINVGPTGEGAAHSCVGCHGYIGLLGDADIAHSVHGDARCEICHGGESSVKTADAARNAVKWVGIGTVVATVAGLGINYLIARKRIDKRKEV